MAGLTRDIEQLIDTMPAGPRIDFLVAKVLGQVDFKHRPFTRVDEVKDGYSESKSLLICPTCGRGVGEIEFCIKSYSAYIVLAWEVIRWWMIHNEDLFIEWWNDGEWFVCDTNLASRRDVPHIAARSDKVNDVLGGFPSFPLAICRLAIKKGIKDNLLSTDDLMLDIENYGSKN